VVARCKRCRTLFRYVEGPPVCPECNNGYAKEMEIIEEGSMPQTVPISRILLQPSDDGGWVLYLDGSKQLPPIGNALGTLLWSLLDEVATLKEQMKERVHG
jgi:hypothetical protein